MKFTNNYAENVKLIEDAFDRDDTFLNRQVQNRHNQQLKISVMVLTCMVNTDIIDRDIVNNLVTLSFEGDADAALKAGISAYNTSLTDDANKAAIQIASGDCVILIADSPNAIIVDTKGMKQRDVSAPESEMTIAGPSEGFNENIMTCLSLVKKRVSTPKLKAEMLSLGRQSKTRAAVCYIDGIVKSGHVKTVKDRLKTIDIDAVLDANYLAETAFTEKRGIFKMCGKTSRPDVFSAKLLEGRVGIIINGTPTALTLPFLFIENFQSADDYYLNYHYANIGRVLRAMGFALSFLIPAVYLALIVHHQNMLPSEWLYSISTSQNGVPLGSILEMVLLFIIFEILRETGTRMPSSIGLALNIVGAIILGQAAVEAKLVSAPMVIVVAFSGTCGLMVSSLKGTVIYIRALYIVMAALLGIAGVFLATILLLINLYDYESIGVPYMYCTSVFNKETYQDTFFRTPIWNMNYRQKRFTDNIKRQGRV